MTQRERRYRLLLVAPDVLLTLLWGWRQHRMIELPLLTGLPPDAEVCDVQYSFRGKCFEVMFWHESFEAVAEGEYVPYHGPLEYEVVRFERPDPDQPVVVDRR